MTKKINEMLYSLPDSAQLRTFEAATFLRVRPSSLLEMVRRGDGPKCSRIGGIKNGPLLFKVSDLKHYIEHRRIGGGRA
ncbi:Helix-turn-helix domain-containing protein [Desulfonatronum thiosulfatophilum]|uniref:Helix-turn-helix domain-containing protein n=2 Tax=Desulfonatronum thiosulfatophilum TaxID=617002 RepID=A0A1G6EUD4_9BACT|nr:Helix-turn-helix domain-containing protein [Desulfonatronum thiosulfatophilum]